MNLTLLVENNPQFESFYTLNLSTWLGLEPVPTKKAESAIGLLMADPNQFKLIIVKAVIDKEESAKLIIAFLRSRGLSIPVIVLGPGKGIDGAYAHIENSFYLKPMIQAAAAALGITAKEMSEKVVPDFYPIPIVHFRALKRPVCDVYIKGGSGYEVKLPKLKGFEQTLITKLITEGQTTLYVDKSARLEFVNNISSELIVTMASSALSEDEQISATEKGVELLSKKLLAIGVTEETISLAKKNMEDIRRNCRGNPKLSKLLDRLLSNKAGYLFKHTQILTYVGLHIVRNVDWGNPDQEEKISFISFFHDIALEKDDHAMIKSNAELKKANLTPEEKQLVERHAMMSAELVSKFPHAPMGSDQIIRQHHGNLNGIGFSEHFGNNVSPISVVFIVAEEFTRIIMNQGAGKLKRDEMIKELKAEFPTSRFQKVIQILETITI